MPSTINEDRIIALTRALRGLPSSTLSAMLVSVLSGDPFRYEVEGQVLSQGKFVSDEPNVETSKYDEHHTDHGKIIDRAGKGVCENCGEEYRFEENGRGRCGVHSSKSLPRLLCHVPLMKKKRVADKRYFV